MNWQEWLAKEAEKSARERLQSRQEEDGEPDEATKRMIAELNEPTMKALRECQKDLEGIS